MKIQLSDHFTYRRLFRFTLPSIVMMVFTSIYSVVDGLFVSNIVGSNGLSSINIVMPAIMVIGAIGFMLGTGGSAEVARVLGEGKKEKAQEYFTTIIASIIVIGVILSIVCAVFMRPLCYMLGASDILIEGCVKYGTISIMGITFFMLQTSFQTFFVVSEKPKLGLLLTVLSGVTNMVLDFLFIYIMKMGVSGAALGTIMGYAVGGLIPFIYFLLPNSSLLRFKKTKPYLKMLLRSCTNGMSEMVSNISASVVTVLFNMQMMRLVGEDGVASITVIMYVNFIFVAILIGFSMGIAPIISYNYGADNKGELKNMFKKSISVVTIVSIIMVVLAEIVAVPVVSMFLRTGTSIFNMTIRGFRIYSISFLLCGINIFASAFFTSLCNGKISALISLFRSLVFPVATTLILPMLWGLDGVWSAIVAAEILTIVISTIAIVSQRKKYGYI